MAKLATTIVVSIGGTSIELVPSLRHAIQLERRPGGFPQLTKDVLDGSLLAACEIIRPHYSDPVLEARLVDQVIAGTLTGPLIEYIMACTGIDADDAANDNEASQTGTASGKRVSFRAFLQDLYKNATGWLGWAPDVALDATPTEIMIAMEGRMDMLKAIFGSSDHPAKSDTSSLSLDDKFKAMFGSFGTTIVQRKEA